jgi:hypothetical protein
MTLDVSHAREVESAYLAGVQANLKAAGPRALAGSHFVREDHDHAEALRAAMIDRRIYDRARYNDLPHGRGFTLRGYERKFLLFRRLRSVTVSTVLAPPGPLLDGCAPTPVTLSQLAAHVRGLLVDRSTPHVIGVCSPCGFTPEAWNTSLDFPNAQVVLIEPLSNGGWKTGSASRGVDQRLIRLFDPENAQGKLERIRRGIDERRIDLLTGGITADRLADELGVSPALVATGFEQAAAHDRELRVARRGSEVVLYRMIAPAAVQEKGPMSLTDWIKSLFSREGNEGKKIEVLMQRRAALSVSRDRLYDDIGQLEKRARQLDEEGRNLSTDIAKRRLAAQLANLEKDITRLNTTASVLSKQINVISTHIHNLELAQAGSAAQLPTSDELTEAAVSAEEILEQLGASDQLVSGLGVGLAQSAVSAEEAAILKRWEKAEPKATPAKLAQAVPPESPIEPVPSAEPRQAQAE